MNKWKNAHGKLAVFQKHIKWVELEKRILILFLSFLCYCYLLSGEATSASEQTKIQNRLGFFLYILVCLQIKQVSFLILVVIQIKFNTRKSNGKKGT